MLVIVVLVASIPSEPQTSFVPLSLQTTLKTSVVKGQRMIVYLAELLHQPETRSPFVA